MPLIITLAHQKGGVGKSTLAINLYGYFSKAGYKVAIIDIDPQGSITALLKTFGARDGVALFERGSFKTFEELEAQVSDYEIVIIDTPPYLSKELQQVLAISHLVLIPCKASPFDALAVVQTIGLVQEEQKRNPALTAAIVFTMTISGTGFAGQIREHLIQHGIPILQTEIANRVAYARSLLFSTSVMEDDNTKAKDEIERLGIEIIALLDKSFFPMSNTPKVDKSDTVRSLLAKIPTNSITSERKPIIQEIAKEKGKSGRKMHRKEDVTYVRLSPAIPVDLKIEMDVAIKSKFRDVYPTIDTFVEAAIRDFLKSHK